MAVVVRRATVREQSWLYRNRRRRGIAGAARDLADDSRAPVPRADAEAARKEAVLQRIPLPMPRNMPQALVGGVRVLAHGDRVQVAVRPRGATTAT